MKRPFVLAAAGLMAAALAGAAAAESQELTPDDLLFMDIPTVVTAGNKEQSITDSPSTIAVYDGTFIEALGLRTLADLLRLTSGVDT